ncbi:MAG: hypothetical protein A2946_02100 [Candidatus Liptonbacteria bacterium RIFCSPLOWO2_01_FULL_53_13]|uniref:Uncharacterized protein n=1 Tax=Candidatus Liptonbacteria bacterium RIFCSPLOWO2_01_FULL_53_13 TaxID=1798651 RepID=A0A1G2CLV6_9BACT|nr:MAG: hypothetical protein A2946_02100 [Candidatus Liptonbacteria bacterium RIFCSPLOWO2_01_FULL_53_13]
MKEFGGHIGRKYARIDLEGRKVLREGRGRINEFPLAEALEGWKHTFSITAEFDSAANQEIQRRILDILANMENELGVSLLLASRDFPLHATIQNGIFEGEDGAKEKKIFQELAGDEGIIQSEKEITGIFVIFKYLLIDKGNILLTASEIPEAIIEARNRASHEYMAKGLRPLPMEHILHLTLARIVGKPPQGAEKAFNDYQQRLVQLRHAISASPISARIEKVKKGRASDTFSPQ